MPRKVLPTLIALLAFNLTVVAAELKPIFDGKSLSGWTQRGGKATYSVEDNAILGSTVKGTGNSFMCPEKEYGDFILDLDINADKGLNSGVQIRSHAFEKETGYIFGSTNLNIPAGRVHGYQVEVDHRPERRWSGGIYEEGRRNWLSPLPTNSPAGQAFKFGEWNHYHIVCEGDSIKTWINDVPAADLVDSEDLTGFIGLQVHNNPASGVNVRFRNIQLADLGRHEWNPLPTRHILESAQPSGSARWNAEGESIHATHSATNKDAGHLYSEGEIEDFTLRFKFKLVKGVSSFGFGLVEKNGAWNGLKLEMDSKDGIGGIKESLGDKWISKTTAEDAKKSFRPQEWNTLTVSAHGKRIVIHVNGYKTNELLNDTSRAEGKCALELPGGQNADAYFKDFELLGKAN